MKKFTEQFKNKSETIRLNSKERRDLRERLLAYMEYHPLPENIPSGASYGFLNTWRVTRLITVPTMARLTGVCAILFLVVIPAIAERSLPGQMLYPVKLRFNEELRGAFVSSPYQKIEWETERLERRLAEARLLADSGRLTPAAEAEVARAIKSHSASAKESIASIRLNDSDEAIMAEIALTSALEVQSEMIDQRQRTSGNSEVSSLATAVNEAKLSVSTGSADLASYAKVLERVESETTRAYEYLNSLNGVISAQEKKEVERRLSDVRYKVEVATKLKEEDELAAARQLGEALGSSRKIISFMTNLDVRSTVTIGKLVPVTLTPEERKEVLQVKLTELNGIIGQVSEGVSKLATTSSDYISLNEGLTHYRELHEAASSSLAAEDLVAAESAVTNALDLAKGMLGSLIAIGVIEESVASSTIKKAN